MRLIAVAAAALVLAGCSAPAPVEQVDPVRSPADACNTPALGETGLWLEADGDTFEAGVVGEGSTVAVLLHQSGSNYCGWAPFVSVLEENGIRSILINLCDSGLTECAGHEKILTGANAVIAATEWARANGAIRVVVVGASMGGTIAFVAAGSEHGTGIDAVANMAGPISFEDVSAADFAPNVKVPILFAVSETDPVVSVAELENLGGLTTSEQVSFAIGSGHGWDLLFEGSGEFSSVGTSLIEFIEG